MTDQMIHWFHAGELPAANRFSPSYLICLQTVILCLQTEAPGKVHFIVQAIISGLLFIAFAERFLKCLCEENVLLKNVLKWKRTTRF